MKAGFQPRKTQTILLSYRDKPETLHEAYFTFQSVNNKGADQTARMQQNKVFSRRDASNEHTRRR